jgi:hypothetical protein
MKNLLLTIVLIISFVFSVAAQIDTNVVVYSWKLDESLANRIRVDVDTALDNFQQYNPVFRNFTGVETLGNVSLPSQSMVFAERPDNQEFILINAFFPFMKFFNTNTFINTRKPFTKLTYIKGGSNQSKEEMLDVFHSQNLTKTLNFGLRYTTLGSLGQYNFQKVKNNSIGLFSSLSGKLYTYHFSINYNKIIADENGGITNDSLVTDTTFSKTKDIPTVFSGYDNAPRHLPDVSNEIKNLNILAVQEISFRSRGKYSDTTLAVHKKVSIFYPKLVYIFNLNRTSRLFIDKDPTVGVENGIYPREPYFSNNLTRDSLVYWKMSNVARLQFQGRRNNHYFVDYAYEMMNYSMAVRADSTVTDSIDKVWLITEKYNPQGLSYSTRMFNSYVSTGFSKIFDNRLDLNLYARQYLAGYRAGDQQSGHLGADHHPCQRRRLVSLSGMEHGLQRQHLDGAAGVVGGRDKSVQPG